MLKRMWINQPSTAQPLHARHGELVLAPRDPGEERCVTVYPVSGVVVSMVVPREVLSDGWRPMGLNPVKVRCLGLGYAPYDDVTLDVKYFAQFLRGVDGTCAFCHGDPCAEEGDDSDIARFFQATKYADTCPVCEGCAT